MDKFEKALQQLEEGSVSLFEMSEAYQELEKLTIEVIKDVNGKCKTGQGYIEGCAAVKQLVDSMVNLKSLSAVTTLNKMNDLF